VTVSRHLALLLVLVVGVPARAAVCTPELAATARERAHAIQAALQTEAHRARVWTWGWGIGYGALTAGQGVPAFVVHDHGLRADLAVGAVTSGIGLASVVLMPPEVLADAQLLSARLQADGEGGNACDELALAERLLASAADDQRFGSGPVMHLLNAGLNVAAGLVLGLGFGRWSSGAVTAASGLLVGEVQILTLPTALIDSPLGAAASPPAEHAMLVPWAGSGRAGLTFALMF
jgi:hypothetical protein